MKCFFFIMSILSGLCQASDLSAEKALSDILKCRIDKLESTPKDIASSAKCYFEKFDKKMTTSEKSQYANWFNSLGKTRKIWLCDGKAEQIYSYSRITKDLVCLEWMDSNNSVRKNIIFFVKNGEKLELSSIYTPYSWK